MNINFNITCNVYFHDTAFSKEIKEQTVSIQEKDLSTISMNLPKKNFTEFLRNRYSCDDKQLDVIQHEVDMLLQEGYKYAPKTLIARAIKNTKIPVIIDTVFAKIKFPEGYLLQTFPKYYCSSEERRDRYILFTLGIPHTILDIIFGPGYHGYKYVEDFDKSDIIKIKEKYKDILLLYGMYDRIGSARRSGKIHRVLTPDELSRVIDAYEALPPSEPNNLIEDIRRAAEDCNINCDDRALKRLMFHHSIDGYKHIRIPKIKSMQKHTRFSKYTEEELKYAQEIVFLHEYKGLGRSRVSKLTGYTYNFVARVFDIHQRKPITISNEVMSIFKQRYANLKREKKRKRKVIKA